MADTTQQLRDGTGDAGPHRREEHPDGGCIQQAEHGQIKSDVGVRFDESSARVGDAECAPLSDSELAEIFEWMEKSDNRTDELRLLGNGVVPAVAEKAWRVLFAELEYAEREVK